jgi:acetyl-CoA carboxylase beta subunit
MMEAAYSFDAISKNIWSFSLLRKKRTFHYVQIHYQGTTASYAMLGDINISEQAPWWIRRT